MDPEVVSALHTLVFQHYVIILLLGGILGLLLGRASDY
jgi:hypothetical protein